MSAASYGLRTPVGTDNISNGDDDISFNAERLSQLLDMMAFRQSTTNPSRMMPASTNMDTFGQAGLHYTGDAANTATITNLGINYPSVVLNMPATTFVKAQIQLPYGVNSSFLYRTGLGNNTWTPWKRLGAGWHRGELPLASNPYLMRGPEWVGAWDISGAATSSSILGTPPPGMSAWAPGQIVVVGGGGGNTNLSTIFYSPYAPAAQVQQYWTMTIKAYSQTGEAAWTPWTDLCKGGGGSSTSLVGAGVPSELMNRAFKDAVPRVSTGGKGVVVLRFDHGLTNLKSQILALLVARNLPFYVAMNSRLWTIPENSGATQADVRSWLATSRCLVGSHTSDHVDRNTREGIEDTVIGGRRELSEQLGGIPIWAFTVPGVTEFDKFGGFGGGTLDSYATTYMGEVVMANHPLCSGSIGDILRPLDGEIRIGGRHFGWEQATFAAVKTQIDAAISQKKALTLMMHPRNLGLPGYVTIGIVTQVLDYIRDRIDAGQLADIDYHQSHYATL